MTVTAYFTAAPEQADYLFVVGEHGEHIILSLAVTGDLSTLRTGGVTVVVTAAALLRRRWRLITIKSALSIQLQAPENDSSGYRFLID